MTHHAHTSKFSHIVENSGNPTYLQFINGNTGMGVGSSIIYSFLQNNAKTKEKIGVAPLPRMENGVRANATPFSALSIAAVSKQKALAWQFTKTVILQNRSSFQSDWSRQDLLTSKSALDGTDQYRDAGSKVLLDELNYAKLPSLYKNGMLLMPRNREALQQLGAEGTEYRIQTLLNEVSNRIDRTFSAN
jgi:hypothetical protein